MYGRMQAHMCTDTMTAYGFRQDDTFDFSNFKNYNLFTSQIFRIRLRNLVSGMFELTVLQTRIKGCHQLTLPSAAQVLAQSQTLFCFVSLTHHLSSDCSSTSVTSALRRDSNRSGASHVRTIFTLYVGLLCVLNDGCWVSGLHCLFVNADCNYLDPK